MSRVVGRLAPSPTGRMHVGNAYAALAAWLAARAAGGRIALRIEDIDAPRVVPDADRWIMDDLAWLGLDWDGKPVYQSQRLDLYEEVLRSLRSLTFDGGIRADEGAGESAGGGVSEGIGEGVAERAATALVYPCFCSRAEIRAASAPNEGDGFLIYPGTCRHMGERERRTRLGRGDRHSWRIAVPERGIADAVVRFDDRVFGPQRFDLSRQVGDVVVHRSDGLFAYQLAVTVDDLAMGVSQIVRGRDLLRSTAIQLWIRRWLFESGFARGMAEGGVQAADDGGIMPRVGSDPANPEFAHVPLIDAADGRRMAKRLNSLDLGTLRERGIDPREVVGFCAWLLRIIDEPRPMTPTELVPLFAWDGLVQDHTDRVVDADALSASGDRR